MKKTYTGSRHCGTIRFEADIDLSLGTNKCNCSICTKARNSSSQTHSGCSLVKTISATTSSIRRAVITCFAGTAVYTRSDVGILQIGGDYVSITLAALDNVDPKELIDAPVQYADGRNNNWWVSRAETRHL